MNPALVWNSVVSRWVHQFIFSSTSSTRHSNTIASDGLLPSLSFNDHSFIYVFKGTANCIIIIILLGASQRTNSPISVVVVTLHTNRILGPAPLQIRKRNTQPATNNVDRHGHLTLS